jgi:hypothetical protein
MHTHAECFVGCSHKKPRLTFIIWAHSTHHFAYLLPPYLGSLDPQNFFLLARSSVSKLTTTSIYMASGCAKVVVVVAAACFVLLSMNMELGTAQQDCNACKQDCVTKCDCTPYCRDLSSRGCSECAMRNPPTCEKNCKSKCDQTCFSPGPYDIDSWARGRIRAPAGVLHRCLLCGLTFCLFPPMIVPLSISAVSFSLVVSLLVPTSATTSYMDVNVM